jgi:hypothetical protein
MVLVVPMPATERRRQRAVGAKYPCLVRATRFGRLTRTTTRRHAPSRLGFFD